MVLTFDGLTSSGAALAETSSPHPQTQGVWRGLLVSPSVFYIQSPALFENVLRIPDASAVGAKNSVNKHARHICHVSCLRRQSGPNSM